MTVPAAARPGRERAEILVVVKAYPVRTDGHGEAVCVAGVRLDTPKPEWIRVFPVPFRRLPPEQQFAKYDVIRLDLVRGSDSRPESWEPRADTIEVVALSVRLWRDTCFSFLSLQGETGYLRSDDVDHCTTA